MSANEIGRSFVEVPACYSSATAEMPKMSSVINWWGRCSVHAAVFKNWILQLKTKSERLTGALLLKTDGDEDVVVLTV